MEEKNQEVAIACAVKNSAGYVGVGVSHGHAFSWLKSNDNVDIRASIDQGGHERLMITDKGRIVTIEEGWKLGEALGIVTRPLDDVLEDALHENDISRDLTKDQSIKFLTSTHFLQNGFNFNVDKAMMFAYSHNSQVKKSSDFQKRYSAEERFKMGRGMGG